MMTFRRLAIGIGAAGLLAALAASLGAQAPAGNLAMATPTASPTGPVAMRTIARGTVLQAEDVGGQGAATVLGYEAQRVISAGEALRAPAIAPAAVVRAGEPVVLRVELEGVTVTRPGTAMTSARVGQPVRVRVGMTSLSGIATAPGVVRLP